jgi:PPK2 family polyphosphate:nucleotide phosphotransferase
MRCLFCLLKYEWKTFNVGMDHMDLKKYTVIAENNFKLSKKATHVSIKQGSKKKWKAKLAKNILEISKFQNRLFAENRQALLIILQGMDSSGKDGTIKHIMRGVNPQGVNVFSFKHPTTIELEHDYLWRHEQKLPEHGQITIFNRSHYENVLISKVHPKIVLAERLPGINRLDNIDENFWKTRYGQINYFEKRNIETGTSILKFFLHLSKKEQRIRFLDRIDNREKHWKFSSSDISERKFWNAYQDAYEQAVQKTSTKIAPWYIIPADDKLYAHLLISKIILERLKNINPCFPKTDEKEILLMKKAKTWLAKEVNK